MVQIGLQHLSKTYRIPERTEGTLPRLRSFFHLTYTEKQAVRDLSFSIDRGECVAFLGANGAGKSTTILLTSHDLNDLESLCDRLIILEQGQLLFDDTMNKLFVAYPVTKCQ